MRVALVTGGNRGIGVEICRGLATNGVHVLLGSRSLEAGQAAAQGIPHTEAVQLDVTSQSSVDQAVAHVQQRHGRLDILVSCAGVALAPGQQLEDIMTPSTVKPENMLPCYELNVLGIVRVTNAFLPLLEQSPAASIVNVSSNRGRELQEGGTGWALPYTCSKAAVSALTMLYAKEFKTSGKKQLKVNSVCPGFCKTAFNNYRGTKDPADGAKIAVQVALLTDPDGPSGQFFDDDGTVPW